MFLKSNVDEGVMVIAPVGSIDTIGATDFQNAILKGLQLYDKVVIDLSETTYITSAALRAFLIGHKTATTRGISFVVRNISPAIMQVLELSGFAQFICME